MREIAFRSGARIDGLAISPQEVETANRISRERSINRLCYAQQGQLHSLPYESQRFDAAYAIYALKDTNDSLRALAEVKRVLKPEALLLIYDLVKTESYDESNSQHVRIVGDLEYAVGIPPLCTVAQITKDAEAVGFECISEMDVSQTFSWYHHLARNRVLTWALFSRQITALTSTLERVRILPVGFNRFVETFVVGSIGGLIKAGRLGILSGSRILIFRPRWRCPTSH